MARITETAKKTQKVMYQESYSSAIAIVGLMAIAAITIGATL